MPSKIRSDDWERLFGPNAQRRGGPLQALSAVIITVLLLAGIGIGTQFLLRYRAEQQALASARATAIAATAYPLATQTVTAQTATAGAVLAARTAAAAPTAVAGIGSGQVRAGGNLRSEPVIAANNVVGLIWPGDEITFLDQRDVAGQTWFQIQIVKPAANRGGAGVAAGQMGWASQTLLSAPSKGQ